MCHVCFIHSSINGHLGCPYVLPMVNNATVKTGVQISVQVPSSTSLGCIMRSIMTGSYHSSLCTSENCHQVFHRRYTILYAHWSAQVIQFLSILTILVISCFTLLCLFLSAFLKNILFLNNLFTQVGRRVTNPKSNALSQPIQPTSPLSYFIIATLMSVKWWPRAKLDISLYPVLFPHIAAFLTWFSPCSFTISPTSFSRIRNRLFQYTGHTLLHREDRYMATRNSVSAKGNDTDQYWLFQILVFILRGIILSVTLIFLGKVKFVSPWEGRKRIFQSLRSLAECFEEHSTMPNVLFTLILMLQWSGSATAFY